VIALDLHSTQSLATVLTSVLGFASSMSAVRRLARQGALRIVRERHGAQGDVFLKAGRRVARIH
jgi:hypothetical protein